MRKITKIVVYDRFDTKVHLNPKNQEKYKQPLKAFHPM